MELLILFGVAFCFYVVGLVQGWSARERKFFRETIQEEIEEQLKPLTDMILITIEKHAGMIYVYNKESKEFMGQGSTMKEVNEALEKRYPGKLFGCSEAELKLLKATK